LHNQTWSFVIRSDPLVRKCNPTQRTSDIWFIPVISLGTSCFIHLTVLALPSPSFVWATEAMRGWSPIPQLCGRGNCCLWITASNRAWLLYGRILTFKVRRFKCHSSPRGRTFFGI
jgi:hypothetical protein